MVCHWGINLKGTPVVPFQDVPFKGKYVPLQTSADLIHSQKKKVQICTSGRYWGGTLKGTILYL